MTHELDPVLASLDALPVFPLPSAVLLPHELLPLHVFEPRYREMTADVLAGRRVIAVARLAPGWEGDYEGRPPLERTCGAGVVVRHEKLDDGRYNILLRGLARVELEEELPPEHLYRTFRARLIEDAPVADQAQLEAELESVRQMLLALCAARPGPASAALAELAAGAQGASALADVVCGALLADPDRRHRALVTVDVADRLRLAEAAITELLIGHSPTPGLLH